MQNGYKEVIQDGQKYSSMKLYEYTFYFHFYHPQSYKLPTDSCLKRLYK